MKQRRLGANGPSVSAIGFGCMGLSGTYGDADEQESRATLLHALDLGCNFLDTADYYGKGHNEELVGSTIRDRRKDVVLATKFSLVPSKSGGNPDVSNDPAYARPACEASLKRLQTDVIDLFYLHRRDPAVPIVDIVGAMAELVRDGKVRMIGLSEVSAKTLREAHAVHPISALQSEYSLWTRDPEGEILDTCKELGVALVPFSPVGRGLLAGAVTASDFAAGDFRRTLPRFEAENLQRNQALVEAIRALAATKGCTPAQLALAWVLAQGENIIPIPGTRRKKHLEENLAAADVVLTPAELETLRSKLPPIAGPRYSQEQMERVNL